jgi:Spy/CpxP family protein refolding chaperone
MKRTIAIIFAVALSALLSGASVVVAQQQGPVPGQPGVPPPGHPGVPAQSQPDVPPPGQAPHLPNVPNPPNVPNLPNGQNVPNLPSRPPDPLAHVMFPPELIMGHARQLGLTDDQKAFMRMEIQRTTSSFHDLQWKLQDEMELLHEIMKATSVNEGQALTQLNKVLDIEREIKRLHVGMAVRIKNRLTPEQQEKLHVMRMGQHLRMGQHPIPED